MTDQTQPAASAPEAHPGEGAGPAREAQGAAASATIAQATVASPTVASPAVAQVAQVAPPDGSPAHGGAAHGVDDPAVHSPHDPAAHGGHGDGGESEPLGPVDVKAWGAGLLGALLALAVAGAFAISTGRIVV